MIPPQADWVSEYPKPFNAIMIDRFRRIAQRIQILRLPSIVVGLACSISIVVILFISDSREADRWIMPSFVGLLWAMSVYSFIESFRSVPEKSKDEQGFLRTVRQRIRRGSYWFRGLLFLTATGLALVVTSRMVSIWLSEYAN